MIWQSIKSVDRTKPVWLRAKGIAPVLMRWCRRRSLWIGRYFGMTGPIAIYWDREFCEPEEWCPEDYGPAGE